MNENSKLIPSQIIAQSNSAIRKLQDDNELLRQAREAMDAFIGDGTNYSAGINNLKRKMEDYQKVADAFIQANDADVMDHRKLISLVGEHDLIGSHILRQIAGRTRGRGIYEGRIDHYTRLQNDANFMQHIRNFFSWFGGSSFGQSIRRYERLLANNNEILSNYEQKATRYNEIEQATKELFAIGSQLRVKAKLGIGHIRDASAGLPTSFQSDALYAWRSSVLVKKEEAANIKEQALNEFIRQFLIKDDDGNIIGYNWELLGDLNYDALLAGIKLLGVDYNMILEMLVAQKAILPNYGVDWEGYERYLLLEKLKNYWMMQQLGIVIADERFSIYNWRDLSTGERKDLLQEFMDEIVNIFGIEVNPEIQFFNTPSADNRILLGTYLHRRGIGPFRRTVREVSLNEWVVEHANDDFSHEQLFRTILHELRHGYQNSTVDNPELFIVSPPTTQAWEINLSNYISPSQNFAAYEAQIVEVDAKNKEQAWCEVRGCRWP